jgi:hypothetical protein
MKQPCSAGRLDVIWELLTADLVVNLLHLSAQAVFVDEAGGLRLRLRLEKAAQRRCSQQNVPSSDVAHARNIISQ